MKKPRFYKPQWELIVLDLVIWTLATLIMVLWRTLTDKSRHVDYCLVCTPCLLPTNLWLCSTNTVFARPWLLLQHEEPPLRSLCYLGLVAGFYIKLGTSLCGYDGSYSLCSMLFLFLLRLPLCVEYRRNYEFNPSANVFGWHSSAFKTASEEAIKQSY